MLYALLIAALVSGSASTLYVLWRKAKVENERDAANTRADNAEAAKEFAIKAIKDDQEIFTQQIESRDREIAILKAQRDEAIHTLEISTCPGSLRTSLRVSLGVVPKNLPSEP